MTVEKSELLKRVERKYQFFKGEAAKHKKLSRYLWWGSAVISVLIVFFNTFKHLTEGKSIG